MSNKEIPYKIYLNEDEMPKAWYNMRADMKNKPVPLLNPGTHEQMKAEELAPVFCEELIKRNANVEIYWGVTNMNTRGYVLDEGDEVPVH